VGEGVNCMGVTFGPNLASSEFVQNGLPQFAEQDGDMAQSRNGSGSRWVVGFLVLEYRTNGYPLSYYTDLKPDRGQGRESLVRCLQVCIFSVGWARRLDQMSSKFSLSG
jgi:hypothetical protein